MALGTEMWARPAEGGPTVTMHPVTEGEFTDLLPLDDEAKRYLTAMDQLELADPQLYEGLCKDDDYMFWGISVSEGSQTDLVGFATLRELQDSFPITGTCIARTDRIGRGIGQLLAVRRGMLVVDQLGKPGARADTLEVNVRAQALLRKVGYVPRITDGPQAAIPYGLEGKRSRRTHWTLFGSMAAAGLGYDMAAVAHSVRTFDAQCSRVITDLSPAD